MTASGTGPTYVWEPITDLPGDVGYLAHEELAALATVWREQKRSLNPAQLADFLEKLQREWAIETGIIENVYSLTRGITQVLIERGLDAAWIPHSETDKDPQLVAKILDDQKQAIEGLFDFIKSRRPLTTSYVKEVHSLLTRHQETTTAMDQFGDVREVPLHRGEYKEWPNNPTRPDGSVHEYCPPEHVPAEMDRLIELHHEHMDRGVPPEVEAAWLHHRFTQIHPFQDGNGRVARVLASLIFLQADWFPLTITRDDREEYIEALEQADQGDLEPLVEVFVAIQKRAFRRSLSIAEDVLSRDREIDQVIAALRDDFAKEHAERKSEWEEAKKIASELQQSADYALEGVVKKLKGELSRYLTDYDFFVDTEPDDGDRGYYFRLQVVETAKELDYFANLDAFHAWVRLVFKTKGQSELLISFHGMGTSWKGVVAASACFYRKSETEEGSREVVDLASACDEVFQINYVESLEATQRRFQKWLDQSIVTGLQMWRTRQ